MTRKTRAWVIWASWAFCLRDVFHEPPARHEAWLGGSHGPGQWSVDKTRKPSYIVYEPIRMGETEAWMSKRRRRLV